ncbi:hypothetical protein QN277_009739 [Acacia crassicarpa]|uniref:WAT1-related protein n=1 Tax=Acacia crassicarpa TaxID=499986 RepID=A0AAE1IPV1_9FABA|nr:hypothetical protein QN277_009739 [Acacia crassicarpa]
MDSLLSNRDRVRDGVKGTLLMVIVQIVYAVANILLKMAANDGMSLTVLVAYRFLFSTCFLAPLALFFERDSLDNVDGIVLFHAFLCGLFGGSLLHNLYAESLALISVTYVTAMLNLVPATTYILAVLFRLERMSFRTTRGKAKVLGTLTGIGGAMILTFCKGKRIQIWTTHIDLPRHMTISSHASTASSRLWGCLLALATCLSYSLWLIIQGKMTQRFPWQHSSTALTCAMSSFQSVVAALCINRDWNQWKLGWNIRLLTVAFTGILTSGVAYTLIAWCVMKKGPLFVAIFNPVMLVIVTLGGSFILDEPLYVGSVIGMVLVVFGLYMVLWGKSKETNKEAASEQSRACLPSDDNDQSIQICDEQLHINSSIVPQKKPPS